MIWNVLSHDFNADKIVPYNVFRCLSDETIKKDIKKNKITDREQLKEYLTNQFRYYFWARAEHEIMVSGIATRKDPTKIDIFYQLEMNIDLIVDYVIKELKLFKTKEGSKKI